MKPTAINTSSAALQSKPTLVPTNTVSTKDGFSVRARIDPTLPVADVIRQLCSNLKVADHPALYALRDERDVLITDANLRRAIKDKVNLKLVNSPVVEVVDIMEKLSGREDKYLKLALFSLQKYIQEDQFASEFLKREGLAELINVIAVTHGNTLAYALKALQNLMSLDYGWSNIPTPFISRLIEILSNPSNLVNVCRPATSILKRLVEADPRFATEADFAGANKSAQSAAGPSTSKTSVGGKNPAALKPGMKAPSEGVWNYGFDLVFDLMKAQDGDEPWGNQGERPIKVLETVVKRLSSGDSMMAMDSMLLINSLLKNATDTQWEELADQLERLNVRKAVIRLTSLTTSEELTSSTLEFQANLMSFAYRRKNTPLDLSSIYVRNALDTIWAAAKLPQPEPRTPTRHTPRSSPKIHTGFQDVGNGDGILYEEPGSDQQFWVKLGFDSENLRAEFARIVELLSEHYRLFAPGYSSAPSFQPYFLSFHRVHNLALKFFLRIWDEIGAAASDFSRVAALAQSQINYALRDETRPWHEVEHDFSESEYRVVRERQMRELEQQDDLLNKPPVRTLRAKLYKDSFEFIRSQRIQCLTQGAWFVNGIPAPLTGAGSSRESVSLKRHTRPWKFLRLDKSMRYLHFVDSVVKIPIRSGLEDLPERIDASLLLEVITNTCAIPPNIHPGSMSPSDIPTTGSPLVAAPLSFSLLSTRGGSLADLVAENSTVFSDWIDGFNMLRGDHFTTKETADFVQSLTEIGLKIKLLDLSGEKVDIPDALNPPPLPSTTDFFFADYD
ncbi:hypothetical protein M407DRAFT_223702 [Tulasnella calospora MUT 4182]|uniref:ELMO domain-containing protein n=1 Tax=Tulasnella calospora MUT 4182 TaxID=1051891 RepID=A0A0C3QY43_9AGAM|nr:hypothetical protein M407DRAFT_223702 [Tulasnella calospora MUT 4182]